jgi:hypothetical protein
MTFTFLRNDVYFGCAAQLSTKRRMFLFCAPILVCNERRNEEEMSVHPRFIVHVVCGLRKQYMRAQLTKSSFQILRILSMWENVASGP